MASGCCRGFFPQYSPYFRPYLVVQVPVAQPPWHSHCSLCLSDARTSSLSVAGTAQTSTHQPNFTKSTYSEVDKLFQSTLLTLNTFKNSFWSLLVHHYRLWVILSLCSCAPNVVYRSGWAETVEAAHTVWVSHYPKPRDVGSSWQPGSICPDWFLWAPTEQRWRVPLITGHIRLQVAFRVVSESTRCATEIQPKKFWCFEWLGARPQLRVFGSSFSTSGMTIAWHSHVYPERGQPPKKYQQRCTKKRSMIEIHSFWAFLCST